MKRCCFTLVLFHANCGTKGMIVKLKRQSWKEGESDNIWGNRSKRMQIHWCGVKICSTYYWVFRVYFLIQPGVYSAFIIALRSDFLAPVGNVMLAFGLDSEQAGTSSYIANTFALVWVPKGTARHSATHMHCTHVLCGTGIMLYCPGMLQISILVPVM